MNDDAKSLLTPTLYIINFLLAYPKKPVLITLDLLGKV